MSKISVLGAGGWGLALSLSAQKCGHEVIVWSPFTEEIAALSEKRESERLLPGVKIPADIRLTTDLEMAEGSDIIVIATPSFAVRETAARLKTIAEYGVIVNVAKGIEYSTLKTLAEVIEDELPKKAVVVLSGPSHAEEVAREIETSLVATSKDTEAAQLVQKAFSSEKLRVYTNDDMVGVELGGALKNIIAIAAGICEGMGLGDNTRAALITRGLTEMARLGTAMGAKDRTFAGLTGMGDLIVTCTSRHSRNNRFGNLVGRGETVETALKTVGTVEGYYAAAAAYRLKEQYDVELPIIEQAYEVMYNGKSAKDAVHTLMSRPYQSEIDKS